ncbi:hypothetical protein TRFO_23641 [Tritrichomonas foetus]|uniref:Uncharacterized protein n=1 Tax=Tritrichomonas foetus TaxID=1144522 RepID=A0A1J4K944_9EUKA|nr:hypothetical protein TRFO_23641 [Tritrichomonas foetus]|eukprot:OHT08017.1 hypothetical protein TRFO_23641 [Tritrichomonas foetus]
MILIYFFSILSLSNELPDDSLLPFDLIDLYGDWNVLITHSNGQFSDEDFQFSPSIKMFIMKINGSVKITTTALRYIGKLYHANVTDNVIELFDDQLSLVSTISASKLDNQTVFLRGVSPNEDYLVSGFMSPNHKSIITITSTKSDDVYIIRGKPPKVITATEIIQRLLPALSILIFMGFGRVYRARFWNQYAQMNTRTLQKRINEVSKAQKK